MMNINICCWNSRGACAKTFPRLCRELCRIFCIDFLIILEPRCSGDKADGIMKRMGFDNNWRMEAQGYSGGIWVL